MKSTSVLRLSFAAIALAGLGGCQRTEERSDSKATPRPVVAPAQAEVTSDYASDIGKLCDVIRLSGAGEDDAMTLTTANWLAANLTTQESRKFLISIQPLVGVAKADALDAEAKRVGLASCALSAVWRKPDAVPPM